MNLRMLTDSVTQENSKTDKTVLETNIEKLIEMSKTDTGKAIIIGAFVLVLALIILTTYACYRCCRSKKNEDCDVQESEDEEKGKQINSKGDEKQIKQPSENIDTKIVNQGLKQDPILKVSMSSSLVMDMEIVINVNNFKQSDKRDMANPFQKEAQRKKDLEQKKPKVPPLKLANINPFQKDAQLKQEQEKNRLQEKQENKLKIKPVNMDNIANLSVVFNTSSSWQKSPRVLGQQADIETGRTIEVNALEFAESKPSPRTGRKGKKKASPRIVLSSDEED